MNCGRITYDKNCNTTIHEYNYNNDYAFVYVLQLNRTTKTTTDIFIKTNEEEEIIFSGEDGFYTLVTLKVSKNPNSKFHYSNNKFYEYDTEIEVADLLLSSEIEIDYEYFFLTCKLRKCYINICLLIFDNTATINCNTQYNKDLIYKRDLIWSTLNVILFMSEMDQYEEAERLLERITGCNGLCGLEFNNCGCL